MWEGLWEACEGHCGTFNLSFVYALRARGVPARVVTGAYGQPNGLNFHHTNEVWGGDELGWLPADATQGARHLDVSMPGWAWWTPASGEKDFFGVWRSMDASKLDLAESARLLGAAWSHGNLTTERRAFWESSFRRLDSNGDGILSMAELMEGLNSLDASSPLGQGRANVLAQVWDADGDGTVSMDEYVEAMAAADRGMARVSVHAYVTGREQISAAYSFEGCCAYLSKTGQKVELSVPPTEVWVDLCFKEQGRDVSAKAISKNDSQLEEPIFWQHVQVT